MSGLLRRLGGFCARHAPWVLVAWVVIAVASWSPTRWTSRERRPDAPGDGLTIGPDLLDKKLPEQANGSVPIVLQSDSSLAEGATRGRRRHGQVGLGEPVRPAGGQPLQPAGREQHHPGRQDRLHRGGADGVIGRPRRRQGEQRLRRGRARRKAGIEVSAGGYLGQQLSSPSTRTSEIIGVIGALIILLFAFRTFVAAPLPVTTAIVALASGLAIVGLAGHAIDVPSIAPTLGIMLGLAVGTDYSLFIISRHLRFLEEGVEPEESIARSIGSSGSAVVFAGVTRDHRPALPLLQRHPPRSLARLHDVDGGRHRRSPRRSPSCRRSSPCSAGGS